MPSQALVITIRWTWTYRLAVFNEVQKTSLYTPGAWLIREVAERNTAAGLGNVYYDW